MSASAGFLADPDLGCARVRASQAATEVMGTASTYALCAIAAKADGRSLLMYEAMHGGRIGRQERTL